VTKHVTLSACPSQLKLSLSRRGYLLVGAMGGALLLSALSNSGIVLAFGGAIGLFLLGELYTVTLQLRDFTQNTEVTILRPPRDHRTESTVQVSLHSVSETATIDDITLSGHTEATSRSLQEPRLNRLEIPVSSDEKRVNVITEGRVASPERTWAAELTIVDADVPLKQLSTLSRENSSDDARSSEQHSSALELSTSGNEYDGLREYVAGDPLSHIDWKATARQGVLHVREWARQQPERQVLVLDLPSLPPRARRAAVSVCVEQLGLGADAHRTAIAIIRPSGELVFNIHEQQTIEAKIERIRRTVEGASETDMATLDRESEGSPRRPLRQTTQVGKTVASFRRQAGVADNSLVMALQRVHRQIGGHPPISLVSGVRTTTRTIDGVRSVPSGEAIEMHVLSTADQSDANESVVTTLSAETGASVTERRLRLRGVVRSGTQNRPKYALIQQVRGDNDG